MSLFIVVNPVGSKFAKALQSELRSITKEKIFRTRVKKINRNNFEVTPHVLNKIQQFQAFQREGVSSPSFTTQPDGVGDLRSKSAFARTLINSTNGRGIVEFDVGVEPTPRAPLYTAYIPKKAEYRVHVFAEHAVDIQQKRKKRGYENERDTRVRNVQNGYVYCRDGIQPPDGIETLAVAAVKACSYLYGAVDIIYNEKQNKCFVLEVNSRPGLMGTTLRKYAEALVNLFKLRKNNG